VGLLHVMQKLLRICEWNIEDVFWIIVGLVRLFPRPFSVSESVLYGDTDSVFRYEINAFKALVEHNLPQLFGKLKDFGLSLEFLVKKSIQSFYADYFNSDLVFRLWDKIFFAFSTAIA
jgi:hypothetical protein